jgi:hypothetical protein
MIVQAGCFYVANGFRVLEVIQCRELCSISLKRFKRGLTKNQEGSQ